jgi:hypothetical protein
MHGSKVQLLSWNEKLEQGICEMLSLEDIAKGTSGPAGGEKPVALMQVHGLQLADYDHFCL